MTTPGGPGQPGGPAGPWQGGDPGFGVPQPHLPPPQVPQPQMPQMGPAPQPGYQQPLPQPAAPASRVGAHGRPPEGRAGGTGPHWGRIALVAGGAVVVVAIVVVAGIWLLGGSGGAAVGATEKFFAAVKAADTQAAVAVTCRQAPTLPEQMGNGIKGIEGSMGTFDKAVVSAPSTTTAAAPSPDPSAQRDTADFVLQFANGSVSGRAILVSEDDNWKVCFVDLDPPRPATP